MSTLVLTDKTDAAHAEAAVYQATRGTDRLTVELRGFAPWRLRSIASRLPEDWDVAGRQGSTAYLLTKGGEETLITYNVRPRSERKHPNESVAAEIRALLADSPAVLGLQEVIGYDLPEVPGYRLIRDTSRPGRANIAAYVREGLGRVSVTWRDGRETWRRTEHEGQHPARSYLGLGFGTTGVVVGHQAPPTRYHDTGAARREGVKIVRDLLAPYDRGAVLWDANARAGDGGPGPDLLAQLLGGWVAGDGIDNVVGKGARRIASAYFRSVNGVRLNTDHVRGAFRVVLRGLW